MYCIYIYEIKGSGWYSGQNSCVCVCNFLPFRKYAENAKFNYSSLTNTGRNRICI